MSGKIPPWDCINDEMRNRFKQWTIIQLTLLVTPDDLWREQTSMNHDGYHEDVSNEEKRRRNRITNSIIDAIHGRKVDAAVKECSAALGIEELGDAPDLKALNQLLARNPEWYPFAVKQLWQLAHRPPPDKKDKEGQQKKNNRGRKVGEPGRGSPSPDKREQLMYAKEDEKRIKWIWKHVHPAKKQTRAEKPTALEIAAELNGVKQSELRKWKKNH